jgi:hypothetical protein
VSVTSRRGSADSGVILAAGSPRASPKESPKTSPESSPKLFSRLFRRSSSVRASISSPPSSPAAGRKLSFQDDTPTAPLEAKVRRNSVLQLVSSPVLLPPLTTSSRSRAQYMSFDVEDSEDVANELSRRSKITSSGTMIRVCFSLTENKVEIFSQLTRKFTDQV